MTASKLEIQQLEERMRIFLHAHPECFKQHDVLEVDIYSEPPFCDGEFKVAAPGHRRVTLPRHVRTALRRELREWQLPGIYHVQVCRPTPDEAAEALSEFQRISKKRWQ